MRWQTEGGVILGAAALAGAGLILAAALASAAAGAAGRSSGAQGADLIMNRDVPGAPGGAPAPVAATPPEVVERGGAVPDQVLRMAAGRAPFDPSRQASMPYLFPDERIPVGAAPDPPEPPRAPPFREHGTVAAAGGGIAVIEAPGEAPRVLAMGQEILGDRVAAVEGGWVELRDGQGRNVNVAVPEVDPRIAASPTRGRAAEEQERNRVYTESRGAAAAQAVNEAMRRMREQSGGDVRMEMRGDRVILTAPDGTRREITLGGGAWESQVAPTRPAAQNQRIQSSTNRPDVS
jgi:hypothetical protein